LSQNRGATIGSDWFEQSFYFLFFFLLTNQLKFFSSLVFSLDKTILNFEPAVFRNVYYSLASLWTGGAVDFRGKRAAYQYFTGSLLLQIYDFIFPLFSS
jgi:hypothetical protein